MPLVPLREHGHGTPVFCMHPTGGHVNEYVPLAALLDDTPVYALESRACKRVTDEHPSIEAMAADYATLIQAAQPGRIRVLGWSMGASIAHAVACELERRGEVVEAVGLVDPRDDAAPEQDPLEAMRIAIAMAIAIFHPAPPARGIVRSALATLTTTPDVDSLYRWCLDHELLPATVDEQQLVATIRVVPVHRALVAAHVPGQCRARLVLWTGDPRFGRHTRDWTRHTSSTLHETSVGGSHFTIMRAPYVAAIAAALRAA